MSRDGSMQRVSGSFDSLETVFAQHFNSESPLCDLTVQLSCIDGHENIRCIKAVLAARCGPLYCILFGGMQESTLTTISLRECVSSSTARLFLRFLHTGQCSEMQNILEVMELADKYLLPDFLLSGCDCVLEHGLSNSAVFSSLIAAKAACHQRLLEACLQRLKALTFDDWLDNTDLVKLPTQHLASILSCDGFGKGADEEHELLLYRRLVKLASSTTGGENEPLDCVLQDVIRFPLIHTKALVDEVEKAKAISAEKMLHAYRTQALEASGSPDSFIYSEGDVLPARLANAMNLAASAKNSKGCRPRDGRFVEHFLMDMAVHEVERAAQTEGHRLAGATVMKLSADQVMVLLPGKPGSRVADMLLPVWLDWASTASRADGRNDDILFRIFEFYPRAWAPKTIFVNSYPSGTLCTICLARMAGVDVNGDAESKLERAVSLLEWMQILQDAFKEDGRCAFLSPDQYEGYKMFTENHQGYDSLLVEQLNSFHGFEIGKELPQLPRAHARSVRQRTA